MGQLYRKKGKIQTHIMCPSRGKWHVHNMHVPSNRRDSREIKMATAPSEHTICWPVTVTAVTAFVCRPFACLVERGMTTTERWNENQKVHHCLEGKTFGGTVCVLQVSTHTLQPPPPMPVEDPLATDQKQMNESKWIQEDKSPESQCICGSVCEKSTKLKTPMSMPIRKVQCVHCCINV